VGNTCGILSLGRSFSLILIGFSSAKPDSVQQSNTNSIKTFFISVCFLDFRCKNITNAAYQTKKEQDKNKTFSPFILFEGIDRVVSSCLLSVWALSGK